MKRSPRIAAESNTKLNRRTLFLGGSMAAMVAVLGGRMRYLQVDQADAFKLLAEENRISIRLIPPARGLIQDRNGKLIAGNEQNYRVLITRETAGDVELVLKRLASLIPLTEDDITQTLDEVMSLNPFVPVTVAERLSWTDFSKIAVKDQRIAKAKTATVPPVLREPNAQNAMPPKRAQACAKNAAPVMLEMPRRWARTNAQHAETTVTKTAVKLVKRVTHNKLVVSSAVSAALAATIAATLYRLTQQR